MPRTKDAARFFFFSSSEWETMTSLCEPHDVKITQLFLCESFHYCKNLANFQTPVAWHALELYPNAPTHMVEVRIYSYFF